MDKVMPTVRTSDRKRSIYTHGVKSTEQTKKPAHAGNFDEQLKRVIDKQRKAAKSLAES